MTSKVLTVTVNPAVDLYTEVDRLEPQAKLRCREPHYDPGGGGINVARTIARLGGECCSFAVVGGPTGEMLKQLCAAENLEAEWFAVEGVTRQSVMVMEESSRQLYRFILPGPVLNEADQTRMLDRLAEIAPGFDYLVASGSLAIGMGADFYARMAARLRDSGTRFILDTSGAALKGGLDAGLYLVKPDMAEAAELAGRSIAETREDQEALLAELLARGTEIAVVTLGAQGALAADRSGRRIRLRPPHVEMDSAVGAGDCFMGAAVYALSQGRDLKEAIRLGVAAAAATVRTPGTFLATRDDILALAEQVESL